MIKHNNIIMGILNLLKGGVYKYIFIFIILIFIASGYAIWDFPWKPKPSWDVKIVSVNHSITRHEVVIDIRNAKDIPFSFRPGLLFKNTNFDIRKIRKVEVYLWEPVDVKVPIYENVSYNGTVYRVVSGYKTVKKWKWVKLNRDWLLGKKFGSIRKLAKFIFKDLKFSPFEAKKIKIVWYTPVVRTEKGWGSKGYFAIVDELTGTNFDPWWDVNWYYRREITIDNSQNSHTLKDYQVKIEYDLNSLIQQGKLKPDASDLRFTWYNESSGEEIEIPYWINVKKDYPPSNPTFSKTESNTDISAEETNPEDTLNYDGTYGNLKVSYYYSVYSSGYGSATWVWDFGEARKGTYKIKHYEKLSYAGVSAYAEYYIYVSSDCQNWKQVFYKKLTSSETTSATTTVYKGTVKCVKAKVYMQVSGGDQEIDSSIAAFYIDAVWYEIYNETWVKVPEIPAGGTTTIYMYYGNPDASPASNKDKTFPYFMEVKKINVPSQSTAGQWFQFYFDNEFPEPPIIIAEPDMSYNGGEEMVFRLKDITTTSFYIRQQEPSNRDDSHTNERVTYIAIPPGAWTTIEGDVLIQAGRFQTDNWIQKSSGTWTYISYPYSYSSAPVVFSQIQDYTYTGFAQTREKEISNTRFAVAPQPEEKVTSPPSTTVTIGWIAINKGFVGTIDGLKSETGTVTGDCNVYDNTWCTINFQQEYTSPAAIAMMQTYNGGDPAHLRGDDITTTSWKIRIEEDQTYDSERDHVSETHGYWVIDNTRTKVYLRKYTTPEPSYTIGEEQIVIVELKLNVTLKDSNGTIKDSFGQTEDVYFYISVYHNHNTSYIEKVWLELYDPSNNLYANITDESMTIESDDGNTRVYKYIWNPPDDLNYAGNWTYKAYATETFRGESNSTSGTFEVYDDIPPSVISLTVSDNLLTEADVGNTFTITIDYSEPMDTSIAPTISFNPTTNALTSCSGSWIDSDTYQYSCSIADSDEEISGIDISVSGAKDTSGNVQEDYTESDAFSVDMQGPSVSFNPTSQAWTNQDVSVTISASDGFGVSKIYYAIVDKSVTCPAQGSADYTSVSGSSTTVTISDEGEWKICAYAEDTNGNTGDIYTGGPYQIDKTKPETSISLNGTLGNNGWYISDVNVTLSCSDNLSGCNVTYYCVSDTSCTPNTVYTGTFTLSYERINYVCYYSTDNAGNQEDTKCATVKIDKTPPETEITLDGMKQEEGYYSTDVIVTLACTDNASGCNATYYCISKSECTPNSIYEGKFAVTDSGYWYICYYSIDNAGLQEPTNCTSFEIRKPMLLIDPLGLAYDPDSENLTIVAVTYIQNGTAIYKIYGPTGNLISNGTLINFEKTVYYRTIDVSSYPDGNYMIVVVVNSTDQEVRLAGAITIKRPNKLILAARAYPAFDLSNLTIVANIYTTDGSVPSVTSLNYDIYDDAGNLVLSGNLTKLTETIYMITIQNPPLQFGKGYTVRVYDPNGKIQVFQSFYTPIGTYATYNKTSETYNLIANEVIPKLNNIDSKTDTILTYVQDIYSLTNCTYNPSAPICVKLDDIYSDTQYLKSRIEDVYNAILSTNATIHDKLDDIKNIVDYIQIKVDDIYSLTNCTYNPNAPICSYLYEINQTTHSIESDVIYIKNKLESLNVNVQGIRVRTAVPQEVYPESIVRIDIIVTDLSGLLIDPDEIHVYIYDPTDKVFDEGAPVKLDTGQYYFKTYLSEGATRGQYRVLIYVRNGTLSTKSYATFILSSGGPYDVSVVTENETYIAGVKTICATVKVYNFGNVGQDVRITYWIEDQDYNQLSSSETEVYTPPRLWVEKKVCLPAPDKEGIYYFKVRVYYGEGITKFAYDTFEIIPRKPVLEVPGLSIFNRIGEVAIEIGKWVLAIIFISIGIFIGIKKREDIAWYLKKLIRR